MNELVDNQFDISSSVRKATTKSDAPKYAHFCCDLVHNLGNYHQNKILQTFDLQDFNCFDRVICGERGIRTPGACYSTPDFESGTLNRSDISPKSGCKYKNLENMFFYGQ